MIESIDKDLCAGCGNCVKSCSMDVIRFDSESNKAYIAYQEDCSSCMLCELECPANAIYVGPERAISIGPVSTNQ